MKSLRLYTGNSLELLADLLAKALETPPASPLEQEIIVVQSKGMERWLAMRLAAHFGVCANCRFPFPNAFIDEMFQRVLPDLPGTPLFDPEAAAWMLMKHLPDHLDEPGFASLKHYLHRSPENLRRLQLATRLAETFDQYVLYRPELISRWEQGAESHWQAVLWRDFARGLEKQHRAALGKAFLERVRQAAPDTVPLPRRLSLFGISYLPPFHLQILGALASLVEVNVFLLNPCREYWGDITSEREASRIVSHRQGTGWSMETQYLEQGNPLLASMGAQGRDFLELLASFNYEEITAFREPGEETLLTCLQSDILNLKDRTERFPEKTVILPDDRSFEVHSCHGPLREVEVLVDRLLELFEQDGSLLPKDILVMAPAIETYAPFIQALFDTPEDERRRIPYSIADRSLRQESHVAETFLTMLGLWDERLTAAQVQGLLESAAVRARFGLADTDPDLIGGWLREVRIRWGVDEEDRLRWTPHAFRENTWRAGLDRLLLGYAMPGGDRKLFCGILPYDHLEGSEVAVLGCFIEFAEQLFQLTASLNHPRTLGQWSEMLLEMFARFFLPGDEGSRDFQAVRQVLLDLATMQELTGFAEPVDIRVIKWHLERHLDRPGSGFGFLSGGVTFCSMLPMRSIPMRVICLLGMDGNAFPRENKAPDFDLIAKHPRPGDRSTRNDDRYLFLEALISAREKLFISYTGQSARDNSSIPPSVLVSELLDYIHRAFTVAGEGAPIVHPDVDTQADVTIKHRLQPFSTAYFQGDRKLFSYSEEWRKAASCLLREQTPPPSFLATPLAAPEEALKRVNLAHLCRFFGNPAGFFLDQRLGIRLEEQPDPLEETESFKIEGLERFTLRRTLLEARIAGHELAPLYPSLKASGVLPHGVPGELTFKTLSREVEAFARRVEPHLRGEPLEPLAFEVPISDFILAGSIASLFPERLVHYRFATIRAKDRLNLWLPHLVLNLVRNPGYPRESLLMGLRNHKWCTLAFDPLENSRELLEALLEIYWSGLSKPLPFFPETSFHYAEQIFKSTPSEHALSRARSKWTADGYQHGESEDPSFQLCFKAVDPLDAEFERLAAAVFGPLLAGRKER